MGTTRLQYQNTRICSYGLQIRQQHLIKVEENIIMYN